MITYFLEEGQMTCTLWRAFQRAIEETRVAPSQTIGRQGATLKTIKATLKSQIVTCVEYNLILFTCRVTRKLASECI